MKLLFNWQGFQYEDVHDIERFMELCPFFCEGLEHLNESIVDDHEISKETFVKALLSFMNRGKGLIRVVKSKNNKLLGFVIAVVADAPYVIPHIWIYALYSNNLASGVGKFAVESVAQWAKGLGFGELRGNSYRTSGAAFRWLRGLGFHQRSLIFSRKL